MPFAVGLDILKATRTRIQPGRDRPLRLIGVRQFSAQHRRQALAFAQADPRFFRQTIVRVILAIAAGRRRVARHGPAVLVELQRDVRVIDEMVERRLTAMLVKAAEKYFARYRPAIGRRTPGFAVAAAFHGLVWPSVAWTMA